MVSAPRLLFLGEAAFNTITGLRMIATPSKVISRSAADRDDPSLASKPGEDAEPESGFAVQLVQAIGVLNLLLALQLALASPDPQRATGARKLLYQSFLAGDIALIALFSTFLRREANHNPTGFSQQAIQGAIKSTTLLGVFRLWALIFRRDWFSDVVARKAVK